MINLKMEHCGAFMLHLTIYVKNLKKNNERYRTVQSIFYHDACTPNISMQMQIMQIVFFQFIFYQYPII